MPREMLVGLIRVAVVLACAIAVDPVSAAPRMPDCSLKDGEPHSVVRVLDGDTLVVDGGGEVRLIGALAPRAWDAAGDGEDWPLAATAKAELERLVLGHSIELGFGGRRSDRYGRLLAQVFVRDAAAAGPEDERGTTWVQGAMLERGLARAYSLEGSASCLAELLARERVARAAALGVWAEASYAVRGAAEVEHLLERRGTFQIVEGRVRAVADVRGTVFVNFGEDTRQDFTIAIRAQTKRQIVAAGIDPQLWTGRTVRVRGWIERRGGPLIEIHNAGEVEPVTRDGDAALPAPQMLAAPERRSRARPRPPVDQR